MPARCRGGIIAAGDGTRLRAAGFSMPKPLVPVAGVALIEWVIENFRAAGITSLVIIVNEQARECRDWLHARFPDAWCRPRDFVSFVEAALRRPPDTSVLAVTPLVADDNPLWVEVDATSRVRALGGREGTHVTAGMYMLSEQARAASPPPLGRLREFLAWLLEQGEPLYAETIETVVDVDQKSDVALAEALAGGQTRVDRRGDDR